MAPMTRLILLHLIIKGSITNVEAQALYRCRALPRRISDLEEVGIIVSRERKRDLTGQRYVSYQLESVPSSIALEVMRWVEEEKKRMGN